MPQALFDVPVTDGLPHIPTADDHGGDLAAYNVCTYLPGDRCQVIIQADSAVLDAFAADPDVIYLEDV